MAGNNENQNAAVKTYRPWVGMVLSFFIAGTAQFFAGRRFVGIGWLASILFLKFIGFVSLANPLVPGDLPAFVLFAAAFVLWIIMLFQSYQPVPKLRWMGWSAFIILFLVLSEVVFLGMKVFIQPFQMPTASMSPTILGNRKGPDGRVVVGDRIIGEKYIYWFHQPQRGDIVVFKTKGISEDKRQLYSIPADEFYIKRIAGVPGDVISIQKGHLYNRGQIVSQPPALAKLEFPSRPFGSQIYLTDATDQFAVPDGVYFVIGDNTTNSLDSRYWATIPGKYIIGRVSKIYWPLNRAGKVE